MEPLILVTNDDGVGSPGFVAAAEAVYGLGDLLLIAPIRQQTGMGRSYPHYPNSGIIKKFTLAVNDHRLEAYGIEASPAMAVVHAMLELVNRRPTLCVSGINYGENIGLTITASGTIGAALEASAHGIPSIAVSMETDPQLYFSADFAHREWHAAVYHTRRIASDVLTKGLRGDIAVLNVNIPTSVTPETPVRATRHSRQPYYHFNKPIRKDFNDACFPTLYTHFDEETLEPDSDIKAVFIDRVVSITPLTWSINAQQPWSPH